MKLELLDAYNIRARLSASIILLAPIAITVFLCFESVSTIASSSIFAFTLLAFTNYVPILQRRIERKYKYTNYASVFLMPDDKTIDSVSKDRYYHKLASIDKSFAPFKAPENTPIFRECCDSAVKYLRSHTRGNHLVLEENINYGLCKNLLAERTIGIIICVFIIIALTLYSTVRYQNIKTIPIENYCALAFNISVLVFWIFGVTKNMLKATSVKYAKTLISSIDTL